MATKLITSLDQLEPGMFLEFDFVRYTIIDKPTYFEWDKWTVRAEHLIDGETFPVKKSPENIKRFFLNTEVEVPE